MLVSAEQIGSAPMALQNQRTDMEKAIEESDQEQNRSGRSQYYGGQSIDASNGLTAYQRASLIQQAEAAKQRAITTGIAKSAESRAVDAEKRTVSRESFTQKEREIKLKMDEGKLLADDLEAERTLKVLEQGNGFLKDAYGMNPEDPRFDEQMQRMQIGYSLAFGTPGVSKGHPGVEEWMKNNMPIALLRRQNTLNEKVKIDAEKRAQTAATAEQARLAGIAPEMPVTRVVSNGVTRETPTPEKPKEEKPDTWDAYEKDLAAARKSFSIPVATNAKDQIPLPPEVQAQFEARGTALTKGGALPAPTTQPQFTVGNPSGTTAGSSAPVAHPMEGQVVKQKSTGKTGTIVNGVFVEQ
jgi:hypothetical protein